mgnify:CR=1 FL=1
MHVVPHAEAMTTTHHPRPDHDAAHHDAARPRPAARPTPAQRATRNLRTVLAVNAASSGLMGLVGALAPQWSADRLGVEGSATAVRLLGIALVVFAAAVAAAATRLHGRHLRAAALEISVADVAWVALTVATIALAELSATGVALAVAHGAAVAGFAALQLHHRRDVTA